MKNSIVFLVVMMIMFPLASIAQEDLATLARLEGSWSGEGYQQMGQQDRVDFRHEEQVTVLLDGKLILFHGTGFGKENGEKGFEAIGMMYHDISANQTFIHAWTSDGRYTKALVEVTGEGFTWSFDINTGGTVKYATKISGDNWSEEGSYSPDGSTWYPFMETTLSRN